MLRTTKLVGGAIALALSATLLSGCGQATVSTNTTNTTGNHPVYGGTLNVAAQQLPSSLNPVTGRGSAVMFREMMYNTLVTYAPTSTSEIVPSLATSWKELNGGLTYVFYLRHGVTFSNGNPFTAQDVVFTFTYLNKASSSSPVRSAFSDIVGANAVFDGQALTLAGIHAVGKYEVVMDLKRPENYWLNVMAWSFASILDPATISTLNTDPIGTGPFIFKTTNNYTDYVFVKNPHYWDKPYPYLNKISINIGADPQLQVQRFEQGTYNALPFALSFGIDPADYLAIDSSPQWRSDYEQYPAVGLWYLGFNVNVAPFNNPLVRQAMEYAINKPKVVQVALNGRGIAANEILPPGMPGYSASMNEYPQENTPQGFAIAKSLLKKAGIPTGYTTTLTYADSPGVSQMAQTIAQGLQNIGITLKLRPLSQTAFQSLSSQPHGLGMYLQFWFMDYPNPEDFLFNLFAGSQAGTT
ncbi:MAG: ABC transporter substrate-binding protein, partial [Sulfobacillus sp.]